MTEEIKVENFERIPLKNRLHFQLILMKMMLGENPTHEAENDWAEKYSVIVSKIIDDANNAFIRELILSDEKEKYEEVSKILIKIFEEEGKRAA
jgi:hypothetical protein